jgi:proteic killer suppression protein
MLGVSKAGRSVTAPDTHQLKGDRAGTWSISVSGNWRLTFDIRQGEICNLDLEDYH